MRLKDALRERYCTQMLSWRDMEAKMCIVLHEKYVLLFTLWHVDQVRIFCRTVRTDLHWGLVTLLNERDCKTIKCPPACFYQAFAVTYFWNASTEGRKKFEDIKGYISASWRAQPKTRCAVEFNVPMLKAQCAFGMNKACEFLVERVAITRNLYNFWARYHHKGNFNASEAGSMYNYT